MLSLGLAFRRRRESIHNCAEALQSAVVQAAHVVTASVTVSGTETTSTEPVTLTTANGAPTPPPQTMEVITGEATLPAALPTPTPKVDVVVETASPITPTVTAKAISAPVAAGATAPSVTPSALAPTATPPAIASQGFTDGQKEQYTNEGITLRAPANWKVNTGVFGTLFDISVSGTGLKGVLQSAPMQDFPGIMGVVIFESQPGILIQQSKNAKLVRVDRLLTDQKLPITKISFDALLEGVESSGAIYIVSPGATAYVFSTSAPTGQWTELEPSLDLIARSIFFDSSLITLTTAEKTPLTYQASSGKLEVTVPLNWQVTSITDKSFTILILDPKFQFVGAVGTEPGFVVDSSIDINKLLPASGPPDPAVLDQLEQAVFDKLGSEANQFGMNEQQTKVYDQNNVLTLRLAGNASIAQGIKIPVVLYTSLRQEGLTAVVVFGNVEQAMNEGATILQIMDSIKFLP